MLPAYQRVSEGDPVTAARPGDLAMGKEDQASFIRCRVREVERLDGQAVDGAGDPKQTRQVEAVVDAMA